MKKINAVAGAVILAYTSGYANAGTYCNENVNSVILHNSGAVFFKTASTCSTNWCQIQWDTPEKTKSAYAMLLAAKLSDKKVFFYWPNLSACSQANANYASPESMELN